jgi:hypothetical protein
LVELASLAGATGAAGTNGADGANGKDVNMRIDSGIIQYQHVGDSAWTDLITLSTLFANYSTTAQMNTALSAKQDKVAAGTAGTVLTQSGTAGTFGSRAVDTTPTAASSNLVTSGGVASYAVPKPSTECSSAENKCVLITDGSTVAWEVVAR